MHNKEGDNRKQEFLDTALELFHQKGFEATTVRNIIDEVGVSKGAFYHYFSSKEEVMETIARQYVEKKVNIVEKVVEEKHLDALEKFNKIANDMFAFKREHSEMRWKIYKIIARKNNIKLENQIQKNFLELTKPIYEEIIKQGAEEGIFNTNYPGEAAELYVYLNNIFKKMSSEILLNDLKCDLDDLETLKNKMKEPENVEMLAGRFAFYEDTLERVLGVKSNSIKLVESFLQQLKKL